MIGRKKEEIITFKADGFLAEELNKLPNKSEFIRQALLRAIGNECPLCHGTGTLTVSQAEHWRDFLEHHHFIRCGKCNEVHLTCDAYDRRDH